MLIQNLTVTINFEWYSLFIYSFIQHFEIPIYVLGIILTNILSHFLKPICHNVFNLDPIIYLSTFIERGRGKEGEGREGKRQRGNMP